MTARTARVAVLREFRGPMEVQSVPVPEPEPGALVVRVRAATLCGSDVHLWEGQSAKFLPTKLPLILGHETVGSIDALGERAALDSVGQSLAVGDRVIWTPTPCRHCYACTVLKQLNLCENIVVGMHATCAEFPYTTGGFGEFCYVAPGAGRVRVPDDVPDSWAAAASCAVRSAMSAVRVAAPIRTTDHVLIQGAGPLGLFTTAICAVAGAASIAVFDADPVRLAVASSWGATTTHDVRESDVTERRSTLLALTDGRGPDIAFECSGAPGATAEGVDALATGGRYVIAGTLGGEPQPIAVSRVCLRGLKILGVFSAEIDEYWRALRFLRAHRDRFDWDLIFGARYPLEQAGAALEAMRTRSEIKPIMVPSGGGNR